MSREVTEGLLRQGVDEQVRYTIAATPPPVTVGPVTVTDETLGEDVTATVASGAASIQAGAILLPVLKSLQVGHLYRVEVQYTDGFSTLEPYFRVQGER